MNRANNTKNERLKAKNLMSFVVYALKRLPVLVDCSLDTQI